MGVKNFIDKIMYGSDEGEIPEDNYGGNDNELYDDGYEQDNRGKTAAEGQHAAKSQVNIMSGASIEMKVVKPERLDSVTQIADHLLDRKTILLNLEETNKETARRLIDFLNGVAYAISGSLKKVANNTYVITPSNVDVSGEQLHDAHDKGDLF